MSILFKMKLEEGRCQVMWWRMWIKMPFLQLDRNICEVIGHLLKWGCSDWSATHLHHSLFNDKLVRSNKKQIRRCKASCDLVLLYIIKHFLWSIVCSTFKSFFLILFVMFVYLMSLISLYTGCSWMMSTAQKLKTCKDVTIHSIDHGVAVEFHWWKPIGCWLTSPF